MKEQRRHPQVGDRIFSPTSLPEKMPGSKGIFISILVYFCLYYPNARLALSNLEIGLLFRIPP